MASTTAMRITKSSLSSYKSRTEIKHSENVNHLTQSAHKETEASRHTSCEAIGGQGACFS